MIFGLISFALLIAGLFHNSIPMQITFISTSGLFAIAGAISFGIDKLNTRMEKVFKKRTI